VHIPNKLVQTSKAKHKIRKCNAFSRAFPAFCSIDQMVPDRLEMKRVERMKAYSCAGCFT